MTRFNCDICGFSMPIHQNSVGREIVCPRCQQKSLVAAQLTRKEQTSRLVKLVVSLFLITVFVAVLQGILGNVNQSNSSSNTTPLPAGKSTNSEQTFLSGNYKFNVLPSSIPDRRLQIENVRLQRYTNSNGQDLMMLYVDWKNCSQSPIRVVAADIFVYGRTGSVLYSVKNYTVYAVSSNNPGIRPGGSFTEPKGDGHILFPYSSAESQQMDKVELRVTEASEFSNF